MAAGRPRAGTVSGCLRHAMLPTPRWGHGHASSPVAAAAAAALRAVQIGGGNDEKDGNGDNHDDLVISQPTMYIPGVNKKIQGRSVVIFGKQVSPSLYEGNISWDQLEAIILKLEHL